MQEAQVQAKLAVRQAWHVSLPAMCCDILQTPVPPAHAQNSFPLALLCDQIIASMLFGDRFIVRV